MLTDTAIRNAKPKDKPYKMADSGGLYLLVKSAGKYWRMHYRYADKRKTLAIGVYPTVNLLSARKKRDEARDLLIKEIDPVLVKAISKQVKKYAHENTFQTIALEWHAKQSATWAESTSLAPI
ncbi:tyrosine-type recombinase/integrase [Nitrosomonas communis]|uniref:Integrase DNA-binding domain-containing protein n=1 Tax=Nitrosomonas communis TaxID=44574 RepID=A0A1I4UQF2_9PROT|nr:Arm DNA-binding domain-containing protein [Nitrosomonas communis]SFM91135.1 protein of unknown function [Nitrosomonas communis]